MQRTRVTDRQFAVAVDERMCKTLQDSQLSRTKCAKARTLQWEIHRQIRTARRIYCQRKNLGALP